MCMGHCCVRSPDHPHERRLRLLRVRHRRVAPERRRLRLLAVRRLLLGRRRRGRGRGNGYRPRKSSTTGKTATQSVRSHKTGSTTQSLREHGQRAPADMKISVVFPNVLYREGPEGVLQLIKAIENIGYDELDMFGTPPTL